MPCTMRNTLENPPLPILDDGIIFYVYSDTRCRDGDRYMNELELNLDAIKSKDNSVLFYFSKQ